MILRTAVDAPEPITVIYKPLVWRRILSKRMRRMSKRRQKKMIQRRIAESMQDAFTEQELWGLESFVERVLVAHPWIRGDV